ncbi:MAG: tRNA-intron lyase, partial [Nitrososphaerales archaeon]
MPQAAKVATGRLFENRIVVWDIEASRRLFKDSYYGKPLGIPKPKDFEFDAPLILDLMESYYLVKKKKLRVESEEGEALSAK